MLILVAVSISVAINSGLFQAAGKATKETKNAQEAEQELAGGKVNIAGEEYNSIEEYIASMKGLTTDGSFDGKINTPKLSADMKPVAWNAAGAEITPQKNEEWYDYENHKWANAKTEDGSYWVWIPRFEYKITPPASGAKAGTIDIRFIDTNTKSGSIGYTTEDGITKSSDDHIIHPAFTNSVENGGWDSELAGFWVAKYEMSMEGKTETGDWTTLIPTDVSNGNIATTNTLNTTSVTFEDVTYTKIRAVSKPNVSSWRWTSVSNCYENAYNYDRAKESHLMKNSELGAVAYLAHSKYGRNGTEVTKNGTGFVSGAGGVATSSTGDNTGIYDLSGAAYECVAAFNDKYSSTGNFYSTTNASYKSSIGTNMGSIGLANGGSTKYLTAYSNDTSYYYIGQNSSYNSFESFEDAGMKVSITGDAIKEVWISGSTGWYSDDLYSVYMSRPFFKRGSIYVHDDARAGVFFSNGSDGAADDSFSFRAVCSL